MTKRTNVLAISGLIVLHLTGAYFLWTFADKFDPQAEKVAQGPHATYIAGGVHQSDHLPFDWKNYEDPERPEFWDDGDGMPPRPFRYFAAHPTEDNRVKLLGWIKKQHEVIAEVVAKLGQDAQSILGDKLAYGKPGTIKFTNQKDLGGDGQRFSWRNISLAYVYSSTCAACQREKPVIDQLQGLGVNIVYFQTDFGKNPPLFAKSQPHTEEIAEIFPYEVTPTLYIKAQGHGTQRIEGYLSFDELYQYINKQFGEDP